MHPDRAADSLQVYFVIVTWNRIEDLSKALESIYRQDYSNMEVVLVDSNSTDGTRERVMLDFPDVRYIGLPHNLGVAVGRNIGMANANGEFLFFLDDDAQLKSDSALRRIINRFEDEPELAVLFPRYQLEDGTDWGWALPYKPTPSLADAQIYSPTFVGCGFCVRRSWSQRIGYFKQEYFREGEEDDYSYRVISEGGRILYFPDVQILHRLNPHQREHSSHRAQNLAHRTENDLIYLPWLQAILSVAWRMPTSLLSAISGRWFMGYIKGCVILLQALPRIARERKTRELGGSLTQLMNTLKSYVVSDFEAAQCMSTSVLGPARVRLTRTPLALIGETEACGRVQ